MNTSQISPLAPLLNQGGSFPASDSSPALNTELERKIDALQRFLAEARISRCQISSIKWANRVICCPFGIACAITACACCYMSCYGLRGIGECAFCHSDDFEAKNRNFIDECCHLPPETKPPVWKRYPECIPACCCESSNEEKRLIDRIAALKKSRPQSQYFDSTPLKRNYPDYGSTPLEPPENSQ